MTAWANKMGDGEEEDENKIIHKNQLLELKQFFDSKKETITLSETFKGKPQKDKEYVDWLLNGGNVGYQWVISKSL